MTRETSVTPSQAIEGEVIPAVPTSRQRIPLKTLRDVRREMARVYCACRHGQIEVTDGSKLTYMLAQLGKVIADHELEARIAALEARQ